MQYEYTNIQVCVYVCMMVRYGQLICNTIKTSPYVERMHGAWFCCCFLLAIFCFAITTFVLHLHAGSALLQQRLIQSKYWNRFFSSPPNTSILIEFRTNYSIVPNLEEDIVSPTNAKSDLYDTHDSTDVKTHHHSQKPAAAAVLNSLKCAQQNSEDDEIGDGLRMQPIKPEANANGTVHGQQQTSLDRPQPERRRRKLPEIPKNKRGN